MFCDSIALTSREEEMHYWSLTGNEYDSQVDDVAVETALELDKNVICVHSPGDLEWKLT